MQRTKRCQEPPATGTGMLRKGTKICPLELAGVREIMPGNPNVREIMPGLAMVSTRCLERASRSSRLTIGSTGPLAAVTMLPHQPAAGPQLSKAHPGRQWPLSLGCRTLVLPHPCQGPGATSRCGAGPAPREHRLVRCRQRRGSALTELTSQAVQCCHVIQINVCAQAPRGTSEYPGRDRH